MLNLPVVDAHVHLWHPDRFRFSWLDGLDAINQPFELEEYYSQTAEVPLKAFVFVEAGTEPHYGWLEAQQAIAYAALEPRLQAIVAAAPLEHGRRARAYLEALVALGPVIKGVRRILQGESETDYCLQPDFVQGVQMLPEFGLTFDICIYHYQLPAVLELVKRCPQTEFILDHIAKPAIKQGELEPWRTNLGHLAAQPNVACKISGLVTEADHRGWQAAQLKPYVERVLEVFGEDRVMFGSDWPVALLASDYNRWVETVDELTTHLGEAARRKLWAENAIRYYRLAS